HIADEDASLLQDRTSLPAFLLELRNPGWWDTVWFRPMLNPSGEEDPKLPSILSDVPTWQAPTLVLHGQLDLLVLVQQAYLLRDALKAANIPYELVIYPYYGH